MNKIQNIDTNSEPEEENLIDLGSNEDIFNEEDLNMFDADLSMDVEQNELTDLSSGRNNCRRLTN